MDNLMQPFSLRVSEIIDHAARSGFDAVKFQTFDLDEMTLDLKRKGFVKRIRVNFQPVTLKSVII